MARVNPPRQDVPESIKTLSPDLYGYLQDKKFFDFQLWKRTGGGDDLIQNITSSEAFETSLSGGQTQEQIADLEQIEDLIPNIQVRDFESKIAASNYTAVNNDFVEGRSSATIKMDANAATGDQIITANGDSSTITVDGNGIELRYKGERDSTLKMRREGTSIHWYLFTDGTEIYWRAS